MDRSHQVFLIARIRPHGSPPGVRKYRCIAALHDKQCYGRGPLRATHRFLTLVRQKENAEIVRAEIRSLDGKYGRSGSPPSIPDVPCPFAATLLLFAWKVDLDPSIAWIWYRHPQLLQAGMQSWEAGRFLVYR